MNKLSLLWNTLGDKIHMYMADITQVWKYWKCELSLDSQTVKHHFSVDKVFLSILLTKDGVFTTKLVFYCPRRQFCFDIDGSVFIFQCFFEPQVLLATSYNNVPLLATWYLDQPIKTCVLKNHRNKNKEGSNTQPLVGLVFLTMF